MGDSIVAEQSRVNQRKQGDKVTRTLGHLSARYVPDFSERKPPLALDIVPAGKPGAIKVFYKGQPLPKAKLELISESGWKRELKTDAQGALVVALPRRGNYVIEVEHLDTTGAPGAARPTSRCGWSRRCRSASPTAARRRLRHRSTRPSADQVFLFRTPKRSFGFFSRAAAP